MSLRVLETVGERDHQHICNRVPDKPEVQVQGRTRQNRFYDTCCLIEFCSRGTIMVTMFRLKQTTSSQIRGV